MRRVPLLVIAILATAWFALGVVQARDVSRAQSLLSAAQLTRAQERSAGSLLDTASFLNPDRQIDELRGVLAAAEGHGARGEAILRGVTRAEPFNITAWYALAQNANSGATYRYALAHLNALLRSFPTRH